MRRDVAFWAATAALLLHGVGNAHYGFFRDELYFIACGRHPALGYVDQPPLVPWLAALTQVLGHSLFALRLVPALAAAALTWVTATLARELGGDRFAQVLAAVCATLAPVLCLQGVLFSTDVFQPLVWTSTLLLLLRLSSGEGECPRGWWLGAALGIGALSKFSIAFFGFALLLGLLVTPARSVLRMRTTWIGLAIGCVLGLPSVLWQLAHGLPFLELLRNGSQGKNVVLGFGAFAGAQVMMLDPLLAPVWLSGLWRVLRHGELRWIGLTYLTLYAVFFLLHGKDYYLSAIYPALFAAGAVQISAWTERVRWPRPVLLGVGMAGSLLLLPMALPILPVEQFIAYEQRLHIVPTTSENQKLELLPQYWADMFGWPELARSVAGVYASLSPGERRRAYILTDNYGEAAGIDFFGRELGLPAAISGHNAYFEWGFGENPKADVMIDVNATVEGDRRFCADVRLGATHHHPHAMPYEQNLGIVVCRGMQAPISELFPRQKHFI